jgi:hydroxymethylpyrimidine/phosphomethylpyrimidine kinase
MVDPEPETMEKRPAVLLVGGLDPSGGSGIALDAVVVRSFGLHALTVLVGIAVQNTERFLRRHDVPSALLREQLATVSEEFRMGSVKTGMLADGEMVETLAAWLDQRPRLPVVTDPVLRSTSGGDLVATGTRKALVELLFPRTRVLVPNLEEAQVFSGHTITERDHIPPAAEALRGLGPDWVLVKGGHLGRGRADDYLCGPDQGFWLEEDRRRTGNIRGTGCALAAGVASGLARGEPVPDAARAAKRWVTDAIDASYAAGQGRFLGVPTPPRIP